MYGGGAQKHENKSPPKYY